MKFPDQFRWSNAPFGYHSKPGDPFGLFVIPEKHANGRVLKVIACCATPESLHWEHVSVSLMEHPKKTPSWDEMCVVKSLFWDDTETVVQFHPAKNEYVNLHPGCLHLWKLTTEPFSNPPSICVGPKSAPSLNHL